VGTRASAKARTTGEAKKPRISKKRPPETALPDQTSTKLSKYSHKTADNKIADTEESLIAVEKQAKRDHKNQVKDHSKKLEDERLALTRKTRLNKQKNTAKKAITNNPLDRPTTDRG
jgi:hypothetical protein